MKIRKITVLLLIAWMVVLSYGSSWTDAAVNTVTRVAVDISADGAGNSAIDAQDPVILENANGKVWRKIANSAAFSPRKLHRVLAFKNKMWLFGGATADSDTSNDIWRTSDGRDWEQVKPNVELPPFDRLTYIVVFKDKLWLFASKGAVWSSSDGIDWIKADSQANYPDRYGIRPIVFKDRIWFIGGWDNENHCHNNDVWYSADGIKWEVAIKAADFSIRSDYSAVVYNNKMWIIAGQCRFPNENDVWYSEDGKKWLQATEAAQFQRRHCAEAVVCYGKIWFMGGFPGDRFLNDVWSSTDGSEWVEQDGNLNRFSVRNEFWAVEYNNKLWVIGGETGYPFSGLLSNDVWCLE